MYREIRYQGLRVSYEPRLDGGGISFGQQFVRAVQEKLGPVGHACEFCSGPGFIGFALLGYGLCERLTLVDINPAAVAACRRTIADNRLEDRVRVYQSDCLDGVPESEQWDLVVSNPPHWPGDEAQYKTSIRLVDPGFSIHDRFYRDVRRFLAPGGTVLFQENSHATARDFFVPMLRSHGLEPIEAFAVDEGPGIDLEGLASRLPPRLVHAAMGAFERVLLHPRLEPLWRDNALFRAVQELPVMRPKHFYFLWSRPREAAGMTPGESARQAANTTQPEYQETRP